jgi:single-strand DNA-binding protein
MSNTIHMQARLGKEPELRDVGDTTVCRLRVVESERYKNKAGEMVEQANWWDADIWGARGQAVAKHFKKGDGIVIRGSIRQREHENEEGNKRTFHTIRVDDWEFPMSRKGDGDSSGGSNDYQPQGSSDDVSF